VPLELPQAGAIIKKRAAPAGHSLDKAHKGLPFLAFTMQPSTISWVR
jgi:hypothetical protein